MPTSAPYHHGNLRPALVEQAVELARESGASGVVLREVARRAGVSHNAAYRHFADREGLLEEVGMHAMGLLETRMRQRVAAIPGRRSKRQAREQLREVGRAYVEFALDEPGLFEVAFAAKEPPGAESGGPYGVLGEILDGMVDVGALSAERRTDADGSCWAAVHGFAELHVHGPLRPVPAPARDQALEHLLAVVDRGLTGP